MTSDQKIRMLDQVHLITGANAVLLNICKDVTRYDREPLVAIVNKLLEACDMINQLGAEPANNIKITEPCPS